MKVLLVKKIKMNCTIINCTVRYAYCAGTLITNYSIYRVLLVITATEHLISASLLQQFCLILSVYERFSECSSIVIIKHVLCYCAFNSDVYIND